MKFAQILTRLTGSPWFITEEALVSVTDLVAARMALSPVTPAGIDDEDDGDALPEQVPGVAVIPVHGVLGNHLSMLERSCGACDYASIIDQARAAANNPDIGSTLLHFKVCPGGTANGCPETFAALREIKASAPNKPMVALITGACCSAGYYMAAACDSIVATESAMTGSVGTIRFVEDRSEAMAKAGVKRFAIKSGRMKDIGNPDRPATAEEGAVLQKMTDYCSSMFFRDMKAARPGIAEEVFETALPYYAADAMKLGLIDAIVPSFESVVASLAASNTLSSVP